MPCRHLFLTTLLFLTPSILAAPFYIVQEECSCQPVVPDTHTDTALLAECQLDAARLKSARTLARKLSYTADIWVDNHHVVHMDVPSRTPPAPPEAERSPLFNTFRDHTSSLRRPKRGQIDERERDDANESALEEQLASRHERQHNPENDLWPKRFPSRKEEAYTIVCRARTLSQSQLADLAAGPIAAAAGDKAVIHLAVRPLPTIFIFLAMLLASATIVEWVLDTWQRYSSASSAAESEEQRIRLVGEERRIYAISAVSGDEKSVEGRDTVIVIARPGDGDDVESFEDHMCEKGDFCFQI